MKNGVAIEVNGISLNFRMYNGQRVVTLKDIDRVHDKPEGSARKRFSDNRKHFIENVDYFLIKPQDFQMSEKRTSGISLEDINNRGTMLFTECGYLMIVKSFSDDKAWSVQRDLVNSYFTLKEVGYSLSEELPINIQSINNTIQNLNQYFGMVCSQVNSMENVLDFQYEAFNKVIENMTLSTRQQEKILQAARKRVNHLLGGAHSDRYRKLGRTYLANLWNNFKSELKCGSSYKDLNPCEFDKALEFINTWTYQER